MLKLQSGGDGTPIAYRCSGAGPPLLLVHGTTADHTRWPSVLPEFEKYFTVYVIDRRGRGESGDSDTYSIKLESEDIATVINSIDEPVNILGHSYGALCCLESALLTKNIAKLILYEPYFTTGDDVYPPGIADRIQELVDAGDRDGAVSMMFREIADMPEAELEMLRSLPSWKKRVAMAHTIARETRTIS
jgi:pimeloyl-ACP methyl ester carboxylesterase